MCWEAIKKLFGWKPEPWVPPYPKEEFDSNQTIDNISRPAAMQEFLTNRHVPSSNDFWLDSLELQVYKTWDDADHTIYPFKWFNYWGWDDTKPGIAWDKDGKRYVALLVGWVNTGTIAHESAHVSQMLLTVTQWEDFISNYDSIKDTDQRIKNLWLYNSYGCDYGYKEAHAEIYRYLCEYMPEELKPFYPKLFA